MPEIVLLQLEGRLLDASRFLRAAELEEEYCPRIGTDGRNSAAGLWKLRSIPPHEFQQAYKH